MRLLIGISFFILSFQVWGQPVLENGSVNYSTYNLDQEEAVNLSGRVEFYWHQLLSPSDFPVASQRNKSYVRLPGIWNDYELDEYTNLSPDGYGTYRFKLIPGTQNRDLAFKMPAVNSAYRMFINGEEIYTVGRPAITAAEYKPEIRPGIIQYTATKDTLDVIIQVSNYKALHGGFLGLIKIGSPVSLREAHNRRIFIDYFLLGALAVISVYFFSMFISYRREKWHLYFSILCLFAMLMIATSDEYVLTYLSWITFDMLYSAELLSIFGSMTFLTLYIRNLFPNEYNKIAAYITIILGSAGMLAAVALPPNISRMTIEPFLFLSIASLSYKMVVVSIATLRGKRGGKIFLIGFTLLVAAVMYDILMDLNYISGRRVAWMGILAFLVSQTYLLSHHFVRTIKKNEILTKDLNRINKNLESEVELRTEKLNNSIKELQAAKKELNQSNNELRNVNDTKNKYLSIIGHDLRGPVSGIKTALELILEDLENDTVNKKDLKETIEALSESANSTYSLLVNLFQWARSQMGNIDYNPEQLNLKKALDETLQLLHENLDNKRISTQTLVNPDTEVYADPNMLAAIFRNLISNAIKFSHPGSKITIESEETERTVEISVADEGVGIDESKLQTIFEYTPRKSTRGTKKEKGTGIGLILVKEFVEQNGGRVSVHSTKGEGTVFIFSLPAAKSNNP